MQISFVYFYNYFVKKKYLFITTTLKINNKIHYWYKIFNIYKPKFLLHLY